MASQDPIIINGTQYEGGGGLIRDALSFASVINKPVIITSIRANRPGRGGLRSEHAVAIELLTMLTGAAVEGNAEASRHLTFRPHASREEDANCVESSLDVRVNGSAAIFMLAVLPYILFGPLGPAAPFTPQVLNGGIEITIRGGTLCVKAPSLATVQQVIVPTLRLIGIGEGNLRVHEEHEQGWHTDFAKLAGRMMMWVKPLEKPLKAFVLDRRGKVVLIRATAHAPQGEIQRFKETIEREFQSAMRDENKDRNKIQIDVFESMAQGNYHLLLVAQTENPQSYLGYEQVYPQIEGFPPDLEKDTPALLTHLTRVCMRGLYNELSHGNAVDHHMENILTIYQSFADGFSSVVAAKNAKLVQENAELEIPFQPPDAAYQLDTATMHRDTSRWIAHELAGIEFVDRAQQFGCRGLGIGIESARSSDDKID